MRAVALVGPGKVPLPLIGRQTLEEDKGGASENLRTAIEGIEVGEDEMEKGGVAEVEQDGAEAEWGGLRGEGGGLLELEAIGLLPQDADLGGTTLVVYRNGPNKLSCLTMLCTVQHRWSAG